MIRKEKAIYLILLVPLVMAFYLRMNSNFDIYPFYHWGMFSYTNPLQADYRMVIDCFDDKCDQKLDLYKYDGIESRYDKRKIYIKIYELAERLKNGRETIESEQDLIGYFNFSSQTLRYHFLAVEMNVVDYIKHSRVRSKKIISRRVCHRSSDKHYICLPFKEDNKTDAHDRS